MATVTRPPSYQRAQMLREGWQTVSGQGSTVLGQFFAFFAAYPSLAQGLYYALMGAWLLFSSQTYQRVTGHQGDPWMFDMIGVLMLALGGTLCLAAYRQQRSPEVLFIAFGSAAGLIGVDLLLIYRGYTALYLLDTALHLGLISFWLYGWMQERQAAATPPQAIPLQSPYPSAPSPAAPPPPLVRG